MARPHYGANLYKDNIMARTLAEMIAPQVSESDATMVDVYGLKSQSADKVAGVHTALAAAGMVPAVGNIADAVDTMLYLTQGDIKGAAGSAVAALPILGLLAGGIKTVKSGAKAIKGAGKLEGVQDIPKMSEKMPRTQTYQFPDVKPQHQTYGNTRIKKLKDKLNSDELDAFEELKVREELKSLEPEWVEKPYYAENWY